MTADVEHRQGCPATGGYGHGVEPCICGAVADVEMLPLPEGEAIGWTQAWSYDQMRTYARANVAHATAAKDAEIEALRAEVLRLEEANRQLHAHGEVLYARMAAIVEAGKALPSPRFAQAITFEGADYVLVPPDDFDALHAALHPTAEQENDDA